MPWSRVAAQGMLCSRVEAQKMPWSSAAAQEQGTSAGGAQGASASHDGTTARLQRLRGSRDKPSSCPAPILLPTSAVSRRPEQLQLHTGRCHRLVPLPIPGEGMVWGVAGRRE